MNRAHIDAVPEQEERCPQGKYHLYRKHISAALGGKKDLGTWAGGHPFDVELIRIPPSASNFPFHSHSAEWELYIFLAGTASIRADQETLTVASGDSIIFPPGEAHQVTNSGDCDLLFYADHALADVIHYPDSGKWFIRPQRKTFFINGTRLL
jgi:uncharacterized cupin superfamily protein